MNVPAALARLEEISARIKKLGSEYAVRTERVEWQCGRGKRARERARWLSRLAQSTAGETSDAVALLRIAFSD